MKKITSQFWIGTIDTVSRFNNFVGENEEFWSEENENSETIPLSEFISSQGQHWYDHDFHEAGYNDKTISILEKFKPYSWVSQWAGLIEEKMKDHGLSEINTFIMMVVDEPPRGSRCLQVKKPNSVNHEGINLIYIGEVTHNDEY